MRKIFGAALAVAAIASFGQFGGASEPVSQESNVAAEAIARAKIRGCDRFQVTETNEFLKRVGIVCENGEAHWISHEGPLRIDGRPV